MQSQHYKKSEFLQIDATKTLSPLNISRHFGYSFQFVVKNNNALSAVAKLQLSNDGENWEDISGATKTLNANGSQTINTTDCFYNFVRAIITYASGTADVFVLQNTKGA